MTRPPDRKFLLLIDASSFLHRGFHALPRLIRSDGLQTGALYGFCNTMLKLMRLNWTAIGRIPSHAAVVLDVKGGNWRHEIDVDYKAQRKPYDPDLLCQIPWLPKIAEAFNVPAIGVPGFEADDIIATYVDKAAGEGMDVVIATSDKDLSVLVGTYGDKTTGTSRVLIYDAMKDKGRDDCAGAIVGDDEVREKFGVWPYQVSDFLAITGDVVDNIQGVPGFGEKTAARLLNQFETLDAIIDAAEWEPEKFLRPKEAIKIVEHSRTLQLSRKLVRLRNDVPVKYDVSDLYVRPAESYALRGLMLDLEFMSLVSKVDRPPKI